ncbi:MULTISPECIES: DUF427 domain-containing protein [Tabrizicola]|uniref:DUF427 domain-containing protein n=1 Tax=Tabrizicola TaxID=1443919 RepID=UPI001080651F|nr:MULTISPECIES: DUF427 domain-containing protein [Paracoccaceae]
MASHITVSPIFGPVTVEAAGVVIGTSHRALELREGSAPPVIYVPRQDIDMARLTKTRHRTTCPWKGEASYYSVVLPATLLENAVWSYETPLPGMAAIAGYLAFYPDKITVRRC